MVVGNYTPIVNTPDGIIPVDPSVQNYTVPLVVTSISPNHELNPNGGQTLIITGDHFPNYSSGPCSCPSNTTTVLIGTNTTCSVIASNLTTITCILGPYNEGGNVTDAPL